MQRILKEKPNELISFVSRCEGATALSQVSGHPSTGRRKTYQRQEPEGEREGEVALLSEDLSVSKSGAHAACWEKCDAGTTVGS